ncbi:MAG TPA: peptidoglycan DD-metalloendopeptidase family protein [Acidimicrobiales bacterium]|nr:peptidoglycan DD-metalloendopeptidase family protein [Acidimicrobiales bacterium]
MTVRGWLAALCAVAVLAGSGVAAAAPAPTTTIPPKSTKEATERKDEIDSRLRTLKEQVEHASEEEADVLERLDGIAARRRTLDARLVQLDQQIVQVEGELAAATAELDEVEADLRRASAKLADTEAGLDRAKRELVDRAVAAYIRNPNLEAAAALLKSEKFRDIASTDSFLETSVRTQRETVARYRELRLRLESEQIGLTASREQVTASRAEVAGARERLVAARSEQSEIRRQVAAEEAEEKKLLDELRSKVKSFEAQIAALKKESDSIAAFLRARQTGKAPAAGSGVLGRPVAGPVTSGFGPRRHPILGTVRTHTGVDFGSASGTPIKAAAAGVVISVGDRGGYGTTVIIDHGGTLATLYAHQSRAAVKDGQTVARGDTVGYVGSTGFSTGPHLHFEVRINGNPVDPLKYL